MSTERIHASTNAPGSLPAPPATELETQGSGPLSLPVGEPPENTSLQGFEAATLVDDTIIGVVERFVERFVFLQNKSHYHLIATWIVGTYLHAMFEYYPYLFACSPDPQTWRQ